MPQPILRTRSRDLSQKVARTLAPLTGHAFAIRRVGPNLEVHPHARMLPRRKINAFIKLAEGIVAADRVEDN